jgi:hypothetical protein
LGALAVAGLWAVLFPGLRHADKLSSAALRPQAGTDFKPAGS